MVKRLFPGSRFEISGLRGLDSVSHLDTFPVGKDDARLSTPARAGAARQRARRAFSREG